MEGQAKNGKTCKDVQEAVEIEARTEGRVTAEGMKLLPARLDGGLTKKELERRLAEVRRWMKEVVPRGLSWHQQTRQFVNFYPPPSFDGGIMNGSRVDKQEVNKGR